MNDCIMCRRWNEQPELRIVELEQTYVMLNRDQFFPGYCFVFAKQHVIELFHLDPARRVALVEEVNRVAEALDRVFRPTKMNYELLGNMVPHMHWHLVPRFEHDQLWPRPIWSEAHEETILPLDECRQRIVAIQEALG